MQQGDHLLQCKRYRDAERHYRQALASMPENGTLLNRLAICLAQASGRRQEALETIDRAIGVEANEGDHWALKALILCDLRRPMEGLAAADQAVRLNPASSYAHTTRATALLFLQRWTDAERSARLALSIDPDDRAASNLLSQSLQHQNRISENAEQIAYMLSRDPENPDTLARAGWNSLQRGESTKAEHFFREALRLDPENRDARAGMLESFRARSIVYRWYLHWCFFLTSFSPRARWFIVLGMVILANAMGELFTGPYRVIGLGILGFYFLFALWSHVARGVGNLMLLFDRFARCALIPREKVEAVAVGGTVVGGIGLLIGGFGCGNMDAVIFGMLAIAAAFPLAHTITNDSSAGRWLFGSFSVVIAVAIFLKIVAVFVPAVNEASGSAFAIAILLAVATSWLAGFNGLRS